MTVRIEVQGETVTARLVAGSADCPLASLAGASPAILTLHVPLAGRIADKEGLRVLRRLLHRLTDRWLEIQPRRQKPGRSHRGSGVRHRP